MWLREKLSLIQLGADLRYATKQHEIEYGCL